MTSRIFLNTQQIWKVSNWERAYIQAYYVLDSTDELDRQSGGITGAGNVIELEAGHGGVITLQEIGAVMKLFKPHRTTLHWDARLARAILEHSRS